MGTFGARDSRVLAQLMLHDFGTTSATTPRQFLRVMGSGDFVGAPEVGFGAELGGVAGSVKFDFSVALTRRQRQEIEESVVASFEWR